VRMCVCVLNYNRYKNKKQKNIKTSFKLKLK